MFFSIQTPLKSTKKVAINLESDFFILKRLIKVRKKAQEYLQCFDDTLKVLKKVFFQSQT